jgi:hypothetical protein
MKILRNVLLLGGLLLLSAGPGVVAQGEPPRCTCPNGNGTYYFLNSPGSPPDDELHCPGAKQFGAGGCAKKLPEGWDRTCANNNRQECFLRRHAASWRLSCSHRLENDCACKNPNPQWCPKCGSSGSEWDETGMGIIKRQVEIEKRLFGKRARFTLIKSPHFYLLTDIRQMKILTKEGAPRVINQHEVAHLYIQRAELAYQRFTKYFGDQVGLSRPMAIYLMGKKRTMEDAQAAYLGSPRTNIMFGGGAKSIAGGYPFNGFGCNLQESRDDHGLHHQVLHSIGHILVSCWIKVDGKDKYLPKWMYAGAGHWLSRYPKKFREMATFCGDEGTPLSNNGRNWRMKIMKIAGSSKGRPIQRLFEVNTIGGLTLDDHVRAWSYFDIFMEEDRERFVKFLSLLRTGKDHRIALKESFGCSPEEWDRRWKDRVLGRRPSVGATAKELDNANPDRPGAAERAGIRTETDPLTLAAKIRALQAVNDPLTAATVVPFLRTEHEMVREVIVLVLSRTKSDEVKKWLRTQGLSGYRGVTRAYVARVIGNLGDKEAGPELMKYTGDGFWLTRAHVARALGLIQHQPAVPILKDMVRDRSQKTRIAAMDAIGQFGEKAASAWELVTDQLGNGAWQVRSAASQCLGDLGQMKSVEGLISRMEIESGRLRKDIREALKKITRDDLGKNPKYWRQWWEKEKERHGGGLPPRGAKKPEPKVKDRTVVKEPTYYGIQVFSEGVGYVLDVSSSMNSAIKIDPNWLVKQKRDYPPRAAKFDLARNEIAASLKTLDPRVKFNLYFFRTRAFTWKSDMVQASSSNIGSAVNRLNAERPASSGGGNNYQTNYVDVFRLVLDVKKGKDLVGNFGRTPDTIFFLTDGQPTAGDITDTDVLNSWFRELNRFARVKVNVITFGNLGVDPEFLRRLAEDNGGVFVQVPEVK